MYNESEMCGLFFEHTRPIVKEITDDYEFICVNDGSSDDTLSQLENLRESDPRIKIISLTRAFGKEIALTAGIDHATGDAVVPMDADLQDPPELLPQLVERWQQGYDTVLAIRSDRPTDTTVKRFSANIFYRLISRISDVPIPRNAGDFRLLDRAVVDALKGLPERNRFMKGLFAWVGFRQTEVFYVRPQRKAGTSKQKYWGLWNFALEGLLSFSTLPLRVWTYLGFLLALASMTYMTFIIVRTLIYGIELPGYASLVVIVLFFSGLNMIGLGILGEYVGRIFLEVKQRPLYLIRQSYGLNEGADDEA